MRLLPAVLLCWFVSSSNCPNGPHDFCKVRELQSGFDGGSGTGLLFCLAEFLGRNRKMGSAPRGVRNGRPCCGAVLAVRLSHDMLAITAFTSRRTNLSPFTKGCREWDASM